MKQDHEEHREDFCDVVADNPCFRVCDGSARLVLIFRINEWQACLLVDTIILERVSYLCSYKCYLASIAYEMA